MARSHADIPGRGPDPAYHGRIRAWWTELGNPFFPGQAPPDVERQYIEAHPNESSDDPKK
jgi:hypothetical protein